MSQYAPCHVSLNVRIKVKKTKKKYNSSYCELGLPVSKLEFKWTRRKKIDFGNELTVLNESSSSRVFVILTNWSFGPQKIMI